MPEPKTGATIMFTEPVWSRFEIPDPNGGLCTGSNRKCSGSVVSRPAEAEQHEAELAQALERFERRLVALERRSLSASTTFDIQPRLTFNRGHDQ